MLTIQLQLLFLCLFIVYITTSLITKASINQKKKYKTQSYVQQLYAVVKNREVKSMTSKDEEILFGSSSMINGEQILKSKKGINTSLLNNGHPTANAKLLSKLYQIRHDMTSCPALWYELSKIDEIKDSLALVDSHLCDTKVSLSFSQIASNIQRISTYFSTKLNLSKHSHVAIFSENSAYWLLADHALQLIGGVSAVRGADAPLEELEYIYKHSDSRNVVILQNVKLFKRLFNTVQLSNDYGNVKHVVLLHRNKLSKDEQLELQNQFEVEIHLLDDILNSSTSSDDSLSTFEDYLPKLSKSDVATIVYTSGTTGNPKGVMLSHGNLLHQLNHRISYTAPYDESEPMPNEKMLSLLPVWHITERTFELWMLSRGCSVVYSSIRSFKGDLAKYKPEWLVLVPRVLEKVASGVQAKFAESSVKKGLANFFTLVGGIHVRNTQKCKGLVVGSTLPSIGQALKSKVLAGITKPLHVIGTKLIWSKVQEGFGANVKSIISGGSALSGNLESFYQIAGMQIIVGYGLTECSPLISFRRSNVNLITAGCVGTPTFDTELCVVDPESFQEVKHGTAGLVMARGPQVMMGYYKDVAATNKAINQAGFFDTGDLGRINPLTHDLILTGRAKDTIVLSNGENVEPSPIEDVILTESTFIDQVMVTGQDGKNLVAIAVLNPLELRNAGFLENHDDIQDAVDVMNDPKTISIDSNVVDFLAETSKSLQENIILKQRLIDDLRKATSSSKFRKWEQVQTVFYTLEPFCMVNGLLTQSYKVKRNQVLERYQDILSSL